MKIILFGASGVLGQELLKLDPNLICPPSSMIPIENFDLVHQFILENKPDIVINAAAQTDNRQIEKFPDKAIQTNIIGSANISRACLQFDIRVVYISTDYIYKGDRGNYKETDEILPFNLYAWTKLGGECSTQAVKNHLIIRTSFGKTQFNYPEAFIDKWSSKDYVEKLAPEIYSASISTLTGVLNLGTERKTLYNHAMEKNLSVKPIKLKDSSFATPEDTSLNLQKWIDYKSSENICRSHRNCRVCGSDQLEKYLDLGMMPLPNNLEFTSHRAKNQDRYPLQIMFCHNCSLSQLSVVMDPGKMFSYYTYRSGVNQGYKLHCQKMAESLHDKYNLNTHTFHIDIAGNDGTLLKEFKNVLDHKVLNIDPASNLTAIAEADGIKCINKFWSEETARDLCTSWEYADLITATNVFAHVDNVTGFIEACRIVLKPTGILVLEFPYLIDFIEHKEFDTTYFEHLSYFSIGPLQRLCITLGMELISVENQSIHGGTVRVIIAPMGRRVPERSVKDFCRREQEDGYQDIKTYQNWKEDIRNTKIQFAKNILELKLKKFKIAAFAASAKGNTLLNSTGMNTDIISYIADETPEKISKFSPGTGIPIVNKDKIIQDPPDYLIILSWNFKEEIINKLRPIYKGKYVIPIPNFEIIE